MPDQAVNAYLVDSGTIQQGRECVAAIVGSVIGGNPDGLQGGLKLFGICGRAGRLSVDSKQDSIVD